jgi:hypothetical protein
MSNALQFCKDGKWARASSPVANQSCYCPRAMDQESLRLLIQRKIRDGRLPRHGIGRVWSSPSAGQTCDACEAIVSRDQLVMEGAPLASGGKAYTFHVRCFQIWDSERQNA